MKKALYLSLALMGSAWAADGGFLKDVDNSRYDEFKKSSYNYDDTNGKKLSKTKEDEDFAWKKHSAINELEWRIRLLKSYIDFDTKDWKDYLLVQRTRHPRWHVDIPSQNELQQKLDDAKVRLAIYKKALEDVKKATDQKELDQGMLKVNVLFLQEAIGVMMKSIGKVDAVLELSDDYLEAYMDINNSRSWADIRMTETPRARLERELDIKNQLVELDKKIAKIDNPSEYSKYKSEFETLRDKLWPRAIPMDDGDKDGEKQYRKNHNR